MLTEMSQPAGGKGKEAMETARNTPYLRDVQPPALKRHAGPRPSSSGHRGSRFRSSGLHAPAHGGGAASTSTRDLELVNRSATER
jgi:hypothetical protein